MSEQAGSAEARYSVAGGQIIRGDEFIGAVEAVRLLNAALDEPHNYAKLGEGGAVIGWQCPVCDALADLDKVLS